MPRQITAAPPCKGLHVRRPARQSPCSILRVGVGEIALWRVNRAIAERACCSPWWEGRAERARAVDFPAFALCHHVPDRAMRAIPSDGRLRCDLCDSTTCAMMMRCSMRDGVSRDVSNLQTSKLKPAVQQNRTPALFARLLLSLLPTPPSLRAAHVTALRAMQPLQVEISTDVLALPTTASQSR
jgi:hypothetical protein